MICNVKKILSSFTDVIFPPLCIVCGTVINETATQSFCAECHRQINIIRSPQCTQCGLPFSNPEGEDHFCGECASTQQYFSVARAVGHYEKALLEAIHKFKYGGKIFVGEVLGRLMAEKEYDSLAVEHYTLIIPIPLHGKRLRERGYNQSLILAKEVARRFSISLDFSILRRNIPTKPQTNLKKKERMANVKGAFEVKNPERIRGQRILLIDDVYTTGSTVRECSRVLLKHHAAEVGILTLARTV